MQCLSCKTEVDPRWKHAVEANSCPFCGQQIMDEKLKMLLGQLQLVLEELKQFPQETTDWLAMNYQLVPASSIVAMPAVQKASQEQSDKVVKVQHKDGSEERVVVKKIQSNDQALGFLNRALNGKTDGNIKALQLVARNEELKTLANQITSGSVIDEGGLTDDLEMDNVVSALQNNLISDDEELPMSVQMMVNTAKANNNGTSGGVVNAADIIKLQQMHDRVAQSRQNFADGTNRGKGGFSRV